MQYDICHSMKNVMPARFACFVCDGDCAVALALLESSYYGKRVLFMNRLADRLMLLALCTLIFLGEHLDLYAVVPVLSAVAAAALCTYLERDMAVTAVFASYCAAASLFAPLIFFVPLLCYDVSGKRYSWSALLALIPAIGAAHAVGLRDGIGLILLAALAVMLQLRATRAEHSRREALALRDATKEAALQLEHKNKELLEKQDYELNLAVLGERNRIARDIHDSVGHTLSNAILQTGALMALNREEGQKERLQTLRDTLRGGMDSIRASLHDLHDDAIDVGMEARALVAGFTFCPITLDYRIDSTPDRNVKYALIVILKEALSNIIRHSNASQVRVVMREHPGFYQFIVSDNGVKQTAAGGEGMGLRNIEQRVSALGGVVTITREGGFTVFVSIPKVKQRKLPV